MEFRQVLPGIRPEAFYAVDIGSTISKAPVVIYFDMLISMIRR